MDIVVVGAGNFGKSVSSVLEMAGARVVLLDRNGYESESIGAAKLILLAVPGREAIDAIQQMGPDLHGDQMILHGCRGVGDQFELISDQIRKHTCVKKIGVIGGPLALEDLQHGHPLVALLATRYDEVFAEVKNLVSGVRVHLHRSRDVIGVEIAGAISNVAMIAAGMASGLNFGERARGVLLTHGLSEAAMLGQAMGGEVWTFAGLAGVGDLIPRPVASTKRNHFAGLLIAEGKDWHEAEAEGCVEGVQTAHEAIRIARSLNLSLPLCEAVHSVLQGESDCRDALDAVLDTDLTLGRDL